MKTGFALLGLTVTVFVYIAVLPSPTSSAKILVPVFFSSKSHKITYMRLLEELASRGHEITLVSPIKPFGKPVKNIKEVYTLNVDDYLGDVNFFEKKDKGEDVSPLIMIEALKKICDASYDLPQVKVIIEKETFDLVFFQPFFNDCVLGWVHKVQQSGAPLVLFTLTAVPSYVANVATGNVFPPSFSPSMFLEFTSEMSFYERFINFAAEMIIAPALFRLFLEPGPTEIYREKLGDPSIPNARDILGNASLVLSNGHFSISGHRPLLPDIVDVGGIHSHPAKPLSKELEDFVDGSGKEGFILFSMGSHMKGMSDSKRRLFLRVFSRLKQRVLWKWDSDSMEGEQIPKNVKLSTWLPQQDLLGHPKMRLFITHCGGGSTEEAIYHGVPLLGIPMFADQLKNADHAKRLGMLVHLEWNDITEETAEKAIQEVLTNAKYTEKAKQISKLFRDQPNDPLTRGVFWVEYVLRHKGAPHLRSASRKLNFFQYHSYDVIAAYLTIILTLLYIIFAIIRRVFRCICGSSRKSTNKKLKKN